MLGFFFFFVVFFCCCFVVFVLNCYVLGGEFEQLAAE